MTRRLVLLALALATSACTTDTVDAFGPMDGGSELSARIQADLPYTGAFEDRTHSGWFSTYGDFVDLGMEASGEYGWAMLMVSGDPDSGDLDVIGCSGEEDGEADFDEPSEDEKVEFEEVEVDGQEALEVRITALFADGSTASAVGHVLR